MKTTLHKEAQQKEANHHWYPFLRYVEKCKTEGKSVSVNEWLISKGKVGDYKDKKRAEQEALIKQKESFEKKEVIEKEEAKKL